MGAVPPTLTASTAPPRPSRIADTGIGAARPRAPTPTSGQPDRGDRQLAWRPRLLLRDHRQRRRRGRGHRARHARRDLRARRRRAAGRGRGTAPGTRCVFQSIENYAATSFAVQPLLRHPRGLLPAGIPPDIGDLFQQGYAGGARIHSNSWGSDVARASTPPTAQNTDALRVEPPRHGHHVLRGNSGIDSDGDGVIDDGLDQRSRHGEERDQRRRERKRSTSHWDATRASPTRAAPPRAARTSIFTVRSAVARRFPANPLNDDPSAGNAEQLAAFSSRGPTEDGRIKPDVVAPGSWIPVRILRSLPAAVRSVAQSRRTGLYQVRRVGLPAQSGLQVHGRHVDGGAARGRRRRGRSRLLPESARPPGERRARESHAHQLRRRPARREQRRRLTTTPIPIPNAPRGLGTSRRRRCHRRQPAVH